ncbi:MAG: DUF3426 domain-containing protein [Aromatoleum sp.]|jgi:predicted Zn finger-like uncharacterized protein|uniref:DUF3426 domain-containing protein n=1 Tax=Aromatoleum sp. TaxID=2307007 RepID=UPI002894E7D7|nr:DUF3426 domain-containing protein [Aromatoleum sp.]MDT3671411.1 DUF3426 domain-containing protein [Aromatoleum sp.]
MMFARCPACQTVFRVRPEQLRAHRGEVRCGRCQTAFNALEHLLEADSSSAEPETRATTASAAAVNEPTTSLPDVRRVRPTTGDLTDSSFFILEERQPEVGDSTLPAGYAPPFGAPSGPEPPAPAEAKSVSADETAAPGVASAGDRIGGSLDFEIPDRLLVPRRPLRTSDLLRREPAIGEPAIESPPKESAPFAAEPSTIASVPSFPEFIDLSELEPAEPASSSITDAPSDELSDSGRRVPFDAWAQRVRSKGGDRGETGSRSPIPADGGRPEADTVPQPDIAREPQPTLHAPSGESSTSSIDLSAPPTVLADAEPATTTSDADGGLTKRHASVDAFETARLDAAYGARPASPAKRWLFGLGIGLLLGMLGVQAAYVFRDEITRAWPPLRPAYLKACEALACTVPLPRLADLVGIGTSDLQSEPGRPGRFILNATVRNRASHPQAYPYLELTLTDSQDRPVVRRVLEPKEWVPPLQLQRAGIEDGFRGGSEIAVKLPFEAEGVAAVGYRLYVFYP